MPMISNDMVIVWYLLVICSDGRRKIMSVSLAGRSGRRAMTDGVSSHVCLSLRSGWMCGCGERSMPIYVSLAHERERQTDRQTDRQTPHQATTLRVDENLEL